ncbi:cytochrome C biogenesis protein [Psychromonas ingrahamii 37]|uniref:Cytochrome c-type biogenesis protein n=1 Tax=Psychromonas ingrahamii (strain DSM 17664 / CCUG 51855 / 37) TaxID=357804 RepID=A1SZ04_PSYIN|nr:cytochrome c-type biogenesis protein [Psychromonas ingrahamii]ABM04719.1 cytochrome C biogenesis protein [Psychromonas ingrahamii 37]
MQLTSVDLHVQNNRFKTVNFSAYLFCLMFFFSPLAFSATDLFEFDNAQQEQTFHDLTKQLRCPKCQNQNIADSNAELAEDLRNKTYELVKEGKNEEQVIAYMVARYGNFIRYDPPMTPATIFLWLGPLLFILVGFYFIYALVKRQKKQAPQLDPDEEQRLQKILGDKKPTDKKSQKGNKQ